MIGKPDRLNDMIVPVRKSVKVLLLNPCNELLLMYVNDPQTTSIDGTTPVHFWHTIGGAIELGESIEQAAAREIWEETGIKEKEIEFGPLVWFGAFDLILTGTRTRIEQQFIVAKTQQTQVYLNHLTQWEQDIAQYLAWFSLHQIQTSTDIIYPVVLSEYLPDIISGNYPPQLIEIDLGKQPKNNG